jgi:ribulose-5-phosphate 4-epimerase/fuculose-1-phosphate aldolase
MNHGLLSTGNTVDEAGFLFGLLDRGCAIQLQVEAAMAGNPGLKKRIITDEEAAYNFKMASERNWLYAEAQPDLEFELEMAGPGVVERGVEDMKVDHGL